MGILSTTLTSRILNMLTTYYYNTKASSIDSMQAKRLKRRYLRFVSKTQHTLELTVKLGRSAAHANEIDHNQSPGKFYQALISLPYFFRDEKHCIYRGGGGGGGGGLHPSAHQPAKIVVYMFITTN